MAKKKVPQILAVLTADIVRSRRIPQKALEVRMTQVSEEISKSLKCRKNIFEFYRGDSFQALIPADDSLKVALLWRAALMATVGKYKWDVRIAIGIGSIDHQGKTLAASGGTAFQHSGALLDNMKHSDVQRIGFSTDDEQLDLCLNTECQLAEGLISRWTNIGAETLYHLMLFNDKQDALAARIGVTQPAIHKRLQTANWPAIRQWEHHFRHTISKQLLPNTE
ncbi:MAG: SatD family protein [Chitinophagaceae bacterium]